MLRNISNYLLQGNNMAYMTAAFIGISIFVYAIFELCKFNYRKHRRLPYNGIKFTTKNITKIAMMIAVSVAITVVISLTLPITVFPPVRVAFSGIMIKITGLFFGPVVGLMVGVITELLCLMFVPSYIHVGYFIVAIGFGFLSGLTGMTKTFKGKQKWITFGIINAYIIVFTAVMYVLMNNFVSIDGVAQTQTILGISVSSQVLPSLFVTTMLITLVIIWLIALILEITHKSEWLENIFPVILLCVVTETLCTIIIASWADKGFLSLPETTNGYMSIVVIRLVISPLKIVFNTIILTTVSIVLKPIIKTAEY